MTCKDWVGDAEADGDGTVLLVLAVDVLKANFVQTNFPFFFLQTTGISLSHPFVFSFLQGVPTFTFPEATLGEAKGDGLETVGVGEGVCVETDGVDEVDGIEEGPEFFEKSMLVVAILVLFASG